jgi:hypothetical protein
VMNMTPAGTKLMAGWKASSLTPAAIMFPQVGRRRRKAQAEKRESAFDNDNPRHAKHHDRRNRRYKVGQQLAHHDAQM